MFFRATQGHTLPHIQDEQALTPLTEDNWPSHFRWSEVIHGTYTRHQYSSERYGLIAGGTEVVVGQEPRLHIHMCSPKMGETGSVRSGYRHNANLILFIVIRKAMRDGIKLRRPHNDVILTRGEDDNGFLPSRYIRKAENRYGNLLILFRNVPKEGDHTYRGRAQPPADLVNFWKTQQQAA